MELCVRGYVVPGWPGLYISIPRGVFCWGGRGDGEGNGAGRGVVRACWDR